MDIIGNDMLSTLRNFENTASKDTLVKYLTEIDKAVDEAVASRHRQMASVMAALDNIATPQVIIMPWDTDKIKKGEKVQVVSWKNVGSTKEVAITLYSIGTKHREIVHFDNKREAEKELGFTLA